MRKVNRQENVFRTVARVAINTTVLVVGLGARAIRDKFFNWTGITRSNGDRPQPSPAENSAHSVEDSPANSITYGIPTESERKSKAVENSPRNALEEDSNSKDTHR